MSRFGKPAAAPSGRDAATDSLVTATFLLRHPREGGGSRATDGAFALDSRFRGNDTEWLGLRVPWPYSATV